MDESGKNELLKKRIIEEAEKDGCVVVCAFDDDETHKKRRNTKRSLILESIILENELRYCRFSERKSKIETAEYFAVFGNPEKTREIIEKEQDAFRALHFYDDIPSVLEGKLFYHPATDKECADFDKRHELHLGEEHLDLRPYVVGPRCTIRNQEYTARGSIFARYVFRPRTVPTMLRQSARSSPSAF